jgi:hypothetical protein
MNKPSLILNNGKSLEDAVQLIRKQAKIDNCLANVCHVFTTRERARVEITLQTLDLTMRRERYQYTKDQLATVLRFFATCGIGRLELDAKRRVVALRDIQVKLQDLGFAAIADDKEIPQVQPFKSDTMPKFAPITTTIETPQAPVQVPQAYGLNKLVLSFNGTVLTVNLKDDANMGEILTMALKFGVLA